jgi:guanylate kinase
MIITLTGPSGAGKSTIERELQALGCGRAISHTTRHPRIGEENGNHYHFVDRRAFEFMEEQGDFVEVINLGSRRYGMSKRALEIAQRDAVTGHAVIVVEPEGAAQIRGHCLANSIPVRSVWVDCGPLQQAERFMKRVTEDLLIGQSAVQAHAERLALMLSTEVGWRLMADEGWIGSSEFLYDHKIDSADHSTPRELALEVLGAVRS